MVLLKKMLKKLKKLLSGDKELKGQQYLEEDMLGLKDEEKEKKKTDFKSNNTDEVLKDVDLEKD